MSSLLSLLCCIIVIIINIVIIIFIFIIISSSSIIGILIILINIFYSYNDVQQAQIDARLTREEMSNPSRDKKASHLRTLSGGRRGGGEEPTMHVTPDLSHEYY